MAFLDALTNKFSRLYKHETYGGNVEVLREEHPEGVKGEAYGSFRALGEVNGSVLLRGHITVGDKFYEVLAQDERENPENNHPANGDSLKVKWDTEEDPDTFPSLVDCCGDCSCDSEDEACSDCEDEDVSNEDAQ